MRRRLINQLTGYSDEGLKYSEAAQHHLSKTMRAAGRAGVDLNDLCLIWVKAATFQSTMERCRLDSARRERKAK